MQRSIDTREQLASADLVSVEAECDYIHAHTRFIELGEQLEDLAMQREYLDLAQSRSRRW